MAISKELAIKITADDKASAVVMKLSEKISSLTGTVLRMTSLLGGVGVGGLFAKSIKEASESQLAYKQLENQMTRLGLSYAGLEGNIRAFADAQQKSTRFSDEAVVSGLTRAIQITNDYEKSLKIVKLAEDAAAATGLDLGTAIEGIARASEGMPRGLVQLGIVMKGVEEDFGKAKNSGELFALVSDLIKEKYGGAAAKSVETFAGKVERLKNNFNELLEKVGNVFLPKLMEFADKMTAKFSDQAFIDKVTGWASAFVDKLTAIATWVTANGDKVLYFMLALGAVSLANSLLSVGSALYGIYKALVLIQGATFARLLLGGGTAALALGGLAAAGASSGRMSPEVFPTDEQAAARWNKQMGEMFGPPANEFGPFLDEVAEDLKKVDNAATKAGKAIKEMWEQTGISWGTESPFERIMRIIRQGETNKVTATDMRAYDQGESGIVDWERMLGPAEKVEKKLTHLQQLAVSFANVFQGRLASVFSRIRSLADLAAFRIKDVFQALGDSILDIFSQIMARLAVMGFFKLLAMFIPGAGAFFSSLGGLIPGFGGGGGSANSMPMPSPGGSVPSGGQTINVNVGTFVGTEEYARQLGMILAKQIRYGQNALGGAMA